MKRIILCLMMACLCSADTAISLGQAEPNAKPASSDDKKSEQAIRQLIQQIQEFADDSNYESAAKLMTKDGVESYAASPVSQAVFMASFSDGEALGMPPEMAEQFEQEAKLATAILKKHGMQKLKIRTDFASPEEMYDASEKLNKKIVKALSSLENKWEVVNDFREVVYENEPEDLSGEPTEFEFEGNKAFVFMELDYSNQFPEDAGQDVEFMAPPVVVRFLKSEGHWKYDGVDVERTMAAEEGMFGSLEYMDEALKLDDMTFEGQTVEGKNVSLEDYQGKVLLIDFWGTWCGPCVASLPKLKKLKQAFKGYDFEIVGIANDSKSELTKFFKKRPLPWKNIVDSSGELADKFGVSAFPTTLLVDQEGNHVDSNLHGDQLMERIAELLDVTDKLDDIKQAMEAESNADEDKESPGKKKQKLDAGEEENAFETADTNGDEGLSVKEFRQYVSAKLDLDRRALRRVFKELDGDASKSLSKSEFAKRFDLLDSAIAKRELPVVGDPGPGYKPFKGLETRLDDRAIYGAIYNRYKNLLDDPRVQWPEVAVKKVPKSVKLSRDDVAKSKPTVSDLVQGTVVIAGGGAIRTFTGGGVIISEDGLVLTNSHIASSINEQMVAMTADGRLHQVTELIANDREKDVALIRIEGGGFEPLPIAKSAPLAGDDIVMMHHSENRFFTYDRGYVRRNSKIGRNTRMEISSEYAPGGSGCGIYNESHELVGLVCEICIGDGPALAGRSEPEGHPDDFFIVVKHAVHLSAIDSLLSDGSQASGKSDLPVNANFAGVDAQADLEDDSFEFKSKWFKAPEMLRAGEEPMATTSAYSSPAMFDVDNDGDVELVVGGIGGELLFCENRGTVGAPKWGKLNPVLDKDGSAIRLNNW